MNDDQNDRISHLSHVELNSVTAVQISEMPDNFTHGVGGLKDLGLTSTIENNCTKKMEIPNPYKKSCLEFEKTDETDSLLKLAKHVFQKISKKPKVAWAPTGIQLKSWPVLHNNLNLIALATTGSGKTLSYAIPMVDSCTNLSKEVLSRQRVHGLVLAPTRELALQISKVLKAVAKSGNKLSGRKNIVSVAIYGGVDKEEQEESLVKKSSGLCSQILLSATPMRLIDLLGIGEGRLSNDRLQSLFLTTNCFVLDEADRLATQSDMTEQVDTIIDFLKSKSACLKSQSLFSATMPKRVIKKCNDWIESPRVTVRVGTVTVGKRSTESGDEDASEEDDKAGDDAGKRKKIKGPLDLSTIPAHITQTLHVCATHKKAKKLCITIKKIRDAEKADSNRRRKGLIIIFFGRIKTLNYIHALLQKEGVQGVPFHSQMFQSKRESQLNLFRSGKCPILLATDIAARGLHCKNVEYIINYDFPSSLEQVSFDIVNTSMKSTAFFCS